jgi:hypothetical protein
VHLEPSPKRHVESFWERRATGMGLDVEIVTGEDNPVQAQPGQPYQHGRPSPVLERKAQAVLL